MTSNFDGSDVTEVITGHGGTVPGNDNNNIIIIELELKLIRIISV